MKASRHYKEAERQLDLANGCADQDQALCHIGIAQVHALLAVAATNSHVLRLQHDHPGEYDRDEDMAWPPRAGDIWRDNAAEKWVMETGGQLSNLERQVSGEPDDMRKEYGPMWLIHRPWIISYDEQECPF